MHNQQNYYYYPRLYAINIVLIILSINTQHIISNSKPTTKA